MKDDMCPEERKHGSSSSEDHENQDSMSSSNDLLDAQQELNLSDDNIAKLRRILKENVSVSLLFLGVFTNLFTCFL